MTKADKVLVVIVIVGSLFAIFFHWGYDGDRGGESQAIIYIAGKETRVVPLRAGMHTQFRVMTPAGYNDIDVDGTRIRVQDADCADRLCVKSGWAAMPSQQLVCLPHRMIIKIVKQGDVDDIAR